MEWLSNQIQTRKQKVQTQSMWFLQFSITEFLKLVQFEFDKFCRTVLIQIHCTFVALTESNQIILKNPTRINHSQQIVIMIQIMLEISDVKSLVVSDITDDYDHDNIFYDDVQIPYPSLSFRLQFFSYRKIITKLVNYHNYYLKYKIHVNWGL